ncbi:MAG: hypothetical protein ABH827_03660 [bacterium]
MKIYSVFLASMLLVHGLKARVMKEQVVTCAGDNYRITLYGNNKNGESSLLLSKVLPSGKRRQMSFYDQTGAYKIIVKSFDVSQTGALSLIVPFEDGYDYQTIINMCDFDSLCQSKNKYKNKKNRNNCFIALSHDKFYKKRRS